MRILGIATCYNRREKTVTALRRLMEGNPAITFDFVIADDGSTDGTAEALQAMDNVTVLPGTGSLYYSGGMRLAIDYAKKSDSSYDDCLLFNDDVTFFDGAIEYLAGKPGNAVWVGPTCDEAGELSYGGILKVSRWRPAVRKIKADRPEGLPCDTFNANCVLIPWEVFRLAPNIHPVYTHAMGDFDYGFRLKQAGIELRVSDQYVGLCSDNPAQGTWSDPSLPRAERFRLKETPKGLPFREWFYYLKKNYNLLTAALYSVIPYLRILIGR